MAVNLSAFGGVGWQFFDNNGVVLSGGLIYTYAAGTTTPAATYTTSAGITAHTNPIVLNSAGRVPGGEIWLEMGLNYKFVLQTSVGVTIATYDNIYGSGSRVAFLDNFTGNNSTTAFTLTATPSNENNTQVYVNGVYQQKNTYSLTGSGNVLTFSQAPPSTSTIEVTYF
jgi:Domain of unknown function (DUF4183)